MSDSCSTSDRCDPLPYSMVEHVERYSVRLDGCRFASMRLAGDAKETLTFVPDACATLPWVHGSNSGGIGVDAVRRIHSVTTGTLTVPSLDVSRRLGTMDALATSWGSWGRPASQRGLVICLN